MNLVEHKMRLVNKEPSRPTLENVKQRIEALEKANGSKYRKVNKLPLQLRQALKITKVVEPVKTNQGALLACYFNVVDHYIVSLS